MVESAGFGSIVWVLAIIGYVLSYLYKSSLKMNKKRETELPDASDDVITSKSVEEILEEMLSPRVPSEEVFEEIIEEPKPQRQQPIPVEPIQPKKSRKTKPFVENKRVVEDSKIQDEEQCDEGREFDNFDLRQAVIMSEILTRKYED